jgi:serine/threonine protein kinase
MHLKAFQVLIDGAQRLLQERKIKFPIDPDKDQRISAIRELQEIRELHSKTINTDFLDNKIYNMLVSEMLDVHLWSIEQLERDSGQPLSFKKVKIRSETSVEFGFKRRDSEFLKSVFDKYKDSESGLGEPELTSALSHIQAPLFPSAECNDLVIKKFLDSQYSTGKILVDLQSFLNLAVSKDKLESYLESKNISLMADALRPHLLLGNHRLDNLSETIPDGILRVSVDVTSQSLLLRVKDAFLETIREEKLFLSYFESLGEPLVVAEDSSSTMRHGPIFRGGAEPIGKLFFHPERKDLTMIAELANRLLYSSGATVVPAAIGIINVLLEQGQDSEQYPLMAQQLFVSLVSHKSSDEFLPLVEQFLDQHLDAAADVMKWKDHSGRSAESTATLLCKRAMLNRYMIEKSFMGVYDITDGLQHEYKSDSCTVYIVDRVEEDKRTRVALKFMKHPDEFERERSIREKLMAAGLAQQQTLQDYIIDTIDSYHYTDAAFCAAVGKHRWLVDYDRPYLLVMPAADRSLRDIMDKERITDADVIKTIFHEILNCVKFMHERGFIHGDLKPRNIMRIIRELVRRIMLIDLKVSAAIGLQHSWSKHSSAYMPPEAIRLSLSLVCRDFDFAVGDAPTSAQFTVEFQVSLPVEIAAGSSFTIAFAPVKVTGVLSLILDDAVDLSSCMSVEYHVITVTAKDALAAGSRRVKMVATFNGDPTTAYSMSARVEHVVNTLGPVQGASKDVLAKCTVTIRNPMKEAVKVTSKLSGANYS